MHLCHNVGEEMSVLIKIEMPESCYYCPFADGVWQKDKRCLINGEEMPRDGRDVQQNHINCPLVEVPTPHGRLIDADNLLNTAFKLVDKETFRAFRQLVIDSTTIIPEETEPPKGES